MQIESGYRHHENCDPFWGRDFYIIRGKRTRTDPNATCRGQVARDGWTERNNNFAPKGQNATRVRLPNSATRAQSNKSGQSLLRLSVSVYCMPCS